MLEMVWQLLTQTKNFTSVFYLRNLYLIIPEINIFNPKTNNISAKPKEKFAISTEPQA
jgi:hypothetical protein